MKLLLFLDYPRHSSFIVDHAFTSPASWCKGKETSKSPSESLLLCIVQCFPECGGQSWLASAAHELGTLHCPTSSLSRASASKRVYFLYQGQVLLSLDLLYHREGKW